MHLGVRAAVQWVALLVPLRRRRALIAHPGERLVAERRSATAVDEHLNVATREINHVRQSIVHPLVDEQQVLEPVAVDVEMRQRLD